MVPGNFYPRDAGSFKMADEYVDTIPTIKKKGILLSPDQTQQCRRVAIGRSTGREHICRKGENGMDDI